MSQALQSHSMKSTETRNFHVDFIGSLDDGEKLTGTPTVAFTPLGLPVSNVQLTTAVKTINRRKVPAGKAVAFTVTLPPAGIYTIIARCGTDSDPAENVEGELTLTVT